MKQISEKLLIISFILIINVLPCFAEIQNLAVGVDGVGCPFCILGIEKKLRTLYFVKSVEFHLKAGIAELSLKPNTTFNIKAIKQAVKDAGFTFRDINLRFHGTDKVNLPL